MQQQDCRCVAGTRFPIENPNAVDLSRAVMHCRRRGDSACLGSFVGKDRVSCSEGERREKRVRDAA
jgi:hypothetical protein